MATKPKIALIIGSTRKTRFADKPAQWMLKQAQARDDMTVELVDLRDFNLPLFDEPASNMWMPSSDPQAIAWQQKLAGYDGFIFVVAEYNHSVTGALKNAMDQAFKEWNHKPMTAIAYGSMGGARALEHLRLIAVELHMVSTRSAVHIGGGDFWKVHPLGSNAPIEEIEGNILQPIIQGRGFNLHAAVVILAVTAGSSLAGNAQYWIGFSHFSLGDHKAAAESHQKLMQVYPTSPKVPDAMLGLARAQIQLGETKAAQSTLQLIVSQHAGTKVAESAQKLLATLK